jgi:acid phosphatase type 7
MKQTLITLAVLVVLGASVLAQATNSDSDPTDQPTPPVRIIHGPVVELVTDSTAQIAWSTNVNAGTLIHYGTDPQNLNQTAGMPWGGLTHRVVLKHLNPSTTYYFKAESAQGQDTGTRAEARQSSFTTVAEGEPPVQFKTTQ